MINQNIINGIFGVLILILFIIVIISKMSNNEYFTTYSNEAIQNLAEVYNSGTLIVDNIQIKNNLSVGGATTLTGTLNTNNISNNGSINSQNINASQNINVSNMKTNSLTVQGLSTLDGLNVTNIDASNITASGNITMNNNNVVTDNMAIGIQAGNGGYLTNDPSGTPLWSQCTPTQPFNWQTMRIVKLTNAATGGSYFNFTTPPQVYNSC